MLQPAPMQFASLYVLREDAHRAALALAQTASFEPVISQPEELPELPGATFRERYHSAHSRLHKLLPLCELELHRLPPAKPQAVSEQDLAQLDEWLGEAWGEFSLHQEGLRHWDEETRHYQALLKSLDAFAKLDIDLSQLRRGGRFLDLRVGSINSNETVALAAALRLAAYVLQPYHEEAGQSHCLIAGPRGREAEILRLLNSAGWHALEVPPEFSGRPEEIRAQLQLSLNNAAANRMDIEEHLARTRDRHREHIVAALHQLQFAAPHAELAEQLHGRGNLALVSGWVPGDRVDALHEALQQAIGARYRMTLREPHADELGNIPSLTRQPRWMRPFTSLVRNYGVPRYTEIDPAPLFALSFIAMFGMMFGDIGHGLLIAAAGLLIPRLAFARALLVSAGISSTLFGALYGSVFGFEEFVHPLWLAPLSDPARMLMAALFWGAGLILVSTALTIYNNLIQGRLADAWFSAKGVAGILFYSGLLYAGYRLGTGATPGSMGVLLLALPLGALVWHLWRSSRGPLGERLLVVAVEALETALNYIANTLSFLRVAAFSMNHVALAIAVFALANMLGDTGHW
ncbi:MAG TPA: V-type ATPase 116kDa subunit family protein, partial [Gallionellaceae bacterium]|nr:V-type ATPase 116kDa subunit family protein [Gallionellaceae bacterium]